MVVAVLVAVVVVFVKVGNGDSCVGDAVGDGGSGDRRRRGVWWSWW